MMELLNESRDVSIRAPDWGIQSDWITPSPRFSLKEVRGCVVVLDFWTYCCINCVHQLETFRKLEEKFAGAPVVFLGIHAAKFQAEKAATNVLEAIQRHDVRHPVINDKDFRIWHSYAVRSWPTLVIIRPDGTIAFEKAGEVEAEEIEGLIQTELDHARTKGQLSSHPFIWRNVPHEHKGFFRYPGKVSVVPVDESYYLAVSDTGNHRLIIFSPEGRILWTIGNGERGLRDGSFSEARLNEPQGVCKYGGDLYVADTGNHVVRRLNLKRKKIETVVGKGKKGVARLLEATRADKVSLRSPWDLVSTEKNIFIAMAGSHQIWLYNPEEGSVEVYAGTGEEGLIDGALESSLWAQPTSLAWDALNSLLYSIDSESSSLRRLNVISGLVDTMVGQGLFDFGDVDGSLSNALFQHPMGLAVYEGVLYIADTFNGKIKRLDPRTGAVSTVLEGLNQPHAIAVAPDGKLWIANTNAHEILYMDLGVSETLGTNPGRLQRLQLQA